jgi:hypothetical protein
MIFEWTDYDDLFGLLKAEHAVDTLPSCVMNNNTKKIVVCHWSPSWRSLLKTFSSGLFGAFAKLLKATVGFVTSVCPSAWNNSAPTGFILWNLVFVFGKSLQKIQVWLMSDKNIGYFNKICVCMCMYIYIYICIYMHTHTHTYIHNTHTHVHTYTHIHTYIHIYIHLLSHLTQFFLEWKKCFRQKL